jgi:hypothetical protein
MCTRFAPDVHLRRLRLSSRVRAFTPDLHLVYTWFTPDLHLMCTLRLSSCVRAPWPGPTRFLANGLPRTMSVMTGQMLVKCWSKRILAEGRRCGCHSDECVGTRRRHKPVFAPLTPRLRPDARRSATSCSSGSLLHLISTRPRLVYASFTPGCRQVCHILQQGPFDGSVPGEANVPARWRDPFDQCLTSGQSVCPRRDVVSRPLKLAPMLARG